jgi:hypothetical protein
MVEGSEWEETHGTGREDAGLEVQKGEGKSASAGKRVWMWEGAEGRKG